MLAIRIVWQEPPMLKPWICNATLPIVIDCNLLQRIIAETLWIMQINSNTSKLVQLIRLGSKDANYSKLARRTEKLELIFDPKKLYITVII